MPEPLLLRIDQREIVRRGRTLCRACAGDSYDTPLASTSSSSQPAPAL